MRSRVALGALFGLVGGFLGFLFQEMLLPHDDALMLLNPVHQMAATLEVGAILGAFLGMAIGAVEGVAVGSAVRLRRGVGLGLLIGAFAGIVGMYIGNVVFNIALMGKPFEQLEQSTDFLDFVHLVLARTLGITFVGALPGVAAGAATLSPKRARHGLIGGLIGGFIGGLTFDLVGWILAPVMGAAAAAQGKSIYGAGGPSRAIAFSLIGLLAGLFVGLVEDLLKQAWVRVLAGRNEGRDYIISKPLTIMGRDERADVPLFGDPALAPQHAAIRIEGNRHYLLDGGTPPAPIVNGQPVTQKQLLRDGDMVQLGQVRMLFREKATASRVGRAQPDAVPDGAQAPGSLSMPSHLCPFCGAVKDANGNCLCSVPSTGQVPGAGVPGPGAPEMAPVQPYTQAMPQGGFPAAVGGAGSLLVGQDGVYAGQVFPVAGPNVTIGRDPGNSIALVADSTVSRRHAHLVDEGGTYVLYDDGSSNGTFVNGARISVQQLAPGDIINFGASKFRYE